MSFSCHCHQRLSCISHVPAYFRSSHVDKKKFGSYMPLQTTMTPFTSANMNKNISINKDKHGRQTRITRNDYEMIKWKMQ